MTQTLVFDLDITRIVSKQRAFLKPNRAAFSISQYNEIRGIVDVAADENTPGQYVVPDAESLIYLVVDRPVSLSCTIDATALTFDVSKVFFYSQAVSDITINNADVDNPVNFLVLYA